MTYSFMDWNLIDFNLIDIGLIMYIISFFTVARMLQVCEQYWILG